MGEWAEIKRMVKLLREQAVACDDLLQAGTRGSAMVEELSRLITISAEIGRILAEA